jgi:RNA polymerase sigma-70 factor, ECF subfamily
VLAPDAVVCNLLRNFPKLAPTGVLEPMLLNGAPGVRLLVASQVDTVVGFAFDNGRISRIFTVRNPQKLGRVAAETALSH